MCRSASSVSCKGSCLRLGARNSPVLLSTHRVGIPLPLDWPFQGCQCGAGRRAKQAVESLDGYAFVVALVGVNRRKKDSHKHAAATRITPANGRPTDHM